MSETAFPEFVMPLRVYIEDTDAGGIVYYVNYLKFMERARTEFMRSHGFGKTAIFSSELMFVVHSIQADYLKPAELDDELQVSAQILKLGGANILFEQQVRRGKELLCRGEVKIVCVDKGGVRPQRLPREMIAELKSAKL